MTNRPRQLVAITLAVVALASIASHLLMWWCWVMARPQVESRFGPSTAAAPALVAGSSLVVFGVDWDRAGRVLDRPVELRGLPSASPCELEGLQGEAPQATLTFLGVSPFDLNEHFVGDFRS